ncbi:MAG TPA: type II secretion system protein GspM [Pseudolabrys sp.]|nr:type II secretion system protein GspM [Pseudolabrys sp.]
MMKQIITLGRAGSAVGVLVVILVALVSGLWFSKEAADAALLELEAKNTSLDALKKRLAIPPPKVSEQAGEASAFLEGANYALAANGMQQRIVELIESSGGKLVSVGVDPPDDAKNVTLRRVVVQANAELTNDGLQQVLYQLESERPFIMVESLNVRNAPKPDGEAAAHDPTIKLAVDLRAFGYFRGANP